MWWSVELWFGSQALKKKKIDDEDCYVPYYDVWPFERKKNLEFNESFWKQKLPKTRYTFFFKAMWQQCYCQYNVTTYTGWEFEREWIHVYVRLNHFAAHLKLSLWVIPMFQVLNLSSYNTKKFIFTNIRTDLIIKSFIIWAWQVHRAHLHLSKFQYFTIHFKLHYYQKNDRMQNLFSHVWLWPYGL